MQRKERKKAGVWGDHHGILTGGGESGQTSAWPGEWVGSSIGGDFRPEQHPPQRHRDREEFKGREDLEVLTVNALDRPIGRL